MSEAVYIQSNMEQELKKFTDLQKEASKMVEGKQRLMEQQS